MRELRLTTGEVALVDDADYGLVSQWNWGYYLFDQGISYVVRTTVPHVRLHRFITGAPRSKLVDHKDHNTLNNQRSNLRVCSTSQNSQNRKGAQANSKSGVRGVFWSERHQRWVGKVQVRGKQVWSCYRKTKEQAEEETQAARQRFMTHSRENG